MSAKVILTVDLGYGDAGKGTSIDFLARFYKAKLVFRHNGGAQAAHNIVTPDGRHHTFSQFGSATFSGVPTFLSRFMLTTPDKLVDEASLLKKNGVENPLSLISIDARAPITTPFHRAANRIREIIRNNGRHGSCGLGIQETVLDVIKHKNKMLYAGDLHNISLVREKLRFLRAAKITELEDTLDVSSLEDPEGHLTRELNVLKGYELIHDIADDYVAFSRQVAIVGPDFLKNQLDDGVIIGEAAQGVLLDEEYGFFPYVTRSKTTTANAETLLVEAGYTDKPYRLGIVRAYGVRHGPGPFVTEDAELTQRLPDHHNVMNQWQREFRVGWFDAVATRYAIQANGGVDGISLTCLDRLEDEPEIKVCTAYCATYADVTPKWFDHFYHDGNCYAIRFVENPSLEHQSELTRQMAHCLPVYDTVARTDLANYIADQLKCPIVMTSYGMTAADKGLIHNFLRMI